MTTIFITFLSSIVLGTLSYIAFLKNLASKAEKCEREAKIDEIKANAKADTSGDLSSLVDKLNRIRANSGSRDKKGS